MRRTNAVDCIGVSTSVYKGIYGNVAFKITRNRAKCTYIHKRFVCYKNLHDYENLRVIAQFYNSISQILLEYNYSDVTQSRKICGIV